MADQTITPVVGVKNAATAIVAGDYESLTAANAGIMTPPGDGKYALHAKCTAAGGAVLTVKAGGGMKSNQGDMATAALAQNDEVIIVIESARFKALSGSDKGKVRITVTDAVSVAAIAVP